MRVQTGRAGRLIALMAAFVLAFAMVLPSAFGADSGTGSPKEGSVSGNVSTQAEGDVNATASGGPVVIMGIDAEDGGPGGHGPIASYISVANSILANVTNGGTGMLVIGGGKSPSDDVTTFWDAVGTGSTNGAVPTYVNGAANIATQSFAGFKMIGVVSGNSDTPGGGLTAAENDALTTRQADIATFVNTGGGLLVFSQGFLGGASAPYGFLGAIGSFTFTTSGSYSDINPTADGTAIGVTDALDVCCWHDTYLTYPSFLVPLAFPVGVTTEVAALGGVSVFIGPPPAPPVVTPAFTG